MKSIPDAKWPLAAFLAVTFTDNPEDYADWIRSTHPKGKVKSLVVRALWLSGHADQIKPLCGDIPDYAAKPCGPLLKRTMRDPDDLDMMWGAFMATGNNDYVNRVIDALDESTPLTGKEEADAVTRRAASWSLKSNMMQHELVFRRIENESKIRKVATRFTFLDNSQVVMIRFEPKDLLGTYKIIARVSDRMGKHSIKLEREIELKK